MALEPGTLVSSLVDLTYTLGDETFTLLKGAKGTYMEAKEDGKTHEVWFDRSAGAGCGYGLPILVQLDQIEKFKTI